MCPVCARQVCWMNHSFYFYLWLIFVVSVRSISSNSAKNKKIHKKFKDEKKKEIKLNEKMKKYKYFFEHTWAFLTKRRTNARSAKFMPMQLINSRVDASRLACLSLVRHSHTTHSTTALIYLWRMGDLRLTFLAPHNPTSARTERARISSVKFRPVIVWLFH